MPPINLLGGEQKRALTPEEPKKIPNQQKADPWADVRAAPTVPAPKKKQQ
jgi:hypothetical protein